MNLLETNKHNSIRQALLFWTNLAREERKQEIYQTSKNLIFKYNESLLEIIFRGL